MTKELCTINLIYVVVAATKLELKRSLYVCVKTPHVLPDSQALPSRIAVEGEEAKVMS